MNTMENSQSLRKFQALLEKLFQFEHSDLDFGIYRILNYKRSEIQDFIRNKLSNIVEKEFNRYKSSTLENIDQEFERVREEIIKNLGKDAFNSIGKLEEKFKDTPLGKEYLKIQQQKEEADKIDGIKIQVFNDLYNFFSRYYEEGDFTPQYRYSIKGHKYAIPYNGEEVKLYWANSDQYYIKTGILFRDYSFRGGNYKVIFRTESAEEELSTNKQQEKQRRFVLSDKELEIDEDKKEVVIHFNYKLLSEREIKEFSKALKSQKGNDEVGGGQEKIPKQEKINEIVFDSIKSHLQSKKHYLLSRELIEETRNEKPLLLYHINRFTAKNTRDFFIHKNLKKFLREQLDYFIKSEVLDIKTLEEERFLDKHITRAKVVREIGEKIIDFLSQIEDFQKRLWEKKKFVIKTDYVITLDRIREWTDEEFFNEIVGEVLKNKQQLKEWEELGFGNIKDKKDLEDKKLPIDTKYFDEEFKLKLLEKISENQNLDDVLDGVLIKSENFQGLNFLLNKYKEKVQTIYIDPPFNKEQDADYLYNVKYKDSTWISMLENRLRLARDLLSERGSIFVRCDYNGNWLVRPLMNEIFGEENFRNEMVISRISKQDPKIKRFNTATDSLFFFSKTDDFSFNLLFKKLAKAKEERWHAMDSQGQGQPLYIFGYLFNPPMGRHWTYGQENIKQMEAEKRIRLKCKNCGYIHFEGDWGRCPKCGNKEDVKVEYLLPPTEVKQIDSNWTDISGYTSNWDFPTENSEILLKRVIESTSNEGDLVLDFFLGSGTTTAVAHKLKRKWIGIEIGEHFWTVILPRMKKVLFYDSSGISKEKDVKEKYNEKSAGGFFKYHTLEQYEDCLDNIELKENKKAEELFKDEYLLKYFLDFETRESEYLLNIEKLKNPFAYKLKITEGIETKEVVVDIPETFSYLLGLKVKKIKVKNNNGRRYLFIFGEKESRDYAVVWREYQDNWTEDDFKKDKEFIKKELKELKPQVVFVNGQSVLTTNFDGFYAEIRYIEPEFKKLMED